MKKLTYRIIESTGSNIHFYLQIRKKFLWVFPYWSDYTEFDGFTHVVATFASKEKAKLYATKIESELNRTETIV